MDSILTQFVEAEPVIDAVEEKAEVIAPSTDDNERKLRAKRQWLYQNDPCVMNLCSNNGISEAVFVNLHSSIRAIEMCFYNFPTIAGIHQFNHITSLCVVAQDIQEIYGLEECTELEKLWICETRVHKIQGIENCTKLKELYLYGNRITNIEGLDTLTKVEKLWLSDNDITILENLSSLVNLQDLRIGNNRIASVGDALNENDLNIAGNQVASFREVLFLARLPKLTSLCLSDPNFADNPICALCNYQTHVIYHLPKLTSLDTLEVTEESRRIISATVLKKRMYYNMRIRTIKRNTNFLIKFLDNTYADAQSTIEADIVALLSRTKRVQKRWDDFTLSTARRDQPENAPIFEKLEDAKYRLTQLIDKKSRTLRALNRHKEDIATHITQQSDMAIRKLLLELETGGNVRFEDEQRDDAWFETCEKLVKDFILKGTSGQPHRRIQIHRISRIHNRYLKNKFEEKLALRSSSDSEHVFEYLCYQTPGGSKAETAFAVVEHGFAGLVEEIVGGGDAVIFANFLECSEEQRGEGEGKESQTSQRKNLRQAVIARSVAARGCEVVDLEETLSQPHPFHHVDFLHQALPLHNIAEDACRMYAIADHDLVLPEYFVEYSIESDLDRLTTRVEKLMVDIAYSNKLSLADMPGIVTEVAMKLGGTDASSTISNVPLSTLEKEFPEINVADDLTIFPRDPSITDVLWSRSPQNAQTLNITGPDTISLETFHAFSQIKSLCLSQCGLETIPSLAAFPLIEKLDLSFNNLRVMPSGLGANPVLKKIDLARNVIVDVEGGVEGLGSLEELDLRFNPIARRKGYRRLILNHIPSLHILDGWPVDKSDKVSSTLPTSLILDRSSTQPHLFRPLSVRTQSGYGSFAAQNDYWRMSHHPHLPEGMLVEAMTTLELDSCHLWSLDELPTGFTNLRWASFRNNYLRDVSKLASYTKLEELSLENNEIESIDSLSSLPNLTKLDASNNRIGSVESAVVANATPFRSLMLLSLENNFLRSVKCFVKLGSLMELYIGNNYIADLLSIFPLKELPRLIILDLTGNAVCQLLNYRLFTIFHLARLKILDGAGISPKEQTSAKEIYLGKLTIELLGEKIGHFAFKNISELDLRSCRIREIDCFAGLDFRNLRRLNFDNNLLTNIDCFVGLTGLKSLSLNGNRIERLLSTDAPAPMIVSGGVGMVGLANGRMDVATPDGGKRRPLLPYLEELHLGHNVVTRIADLGLWRCPHLKVLCLQGNKIGKIDGLEHLTSLQELVLDKNQIRGADPSSFVSLINLRELHMK
ncbi:Leucine-rich repeat-containing protein 9 [Rhizophlyctis rosea]|nr:Leucine-rich repeat-containing protein 9 [Rhizophlyctis rosea]